MIRTTDEATRSHVAYVGWERHCYFELPDRAKKTYKIHIGRLEGQPDSKNRTIQPICHYHAGHVRFYKDNSVIFQHRVDQSRICSKCLERFPGFWARLQSIPPQPKQYYILVLLEKGDQQSTIRVKERFEDLKFALRGRPEFLEELEKRKKEFVKADLLYSHPGLYLFKGSFIDIKAQLKTIVEDIEEVKEA